MKSDTTAVDWVCAGPEDATAPESEWHVLPCRDLKVHTESPGCLCRPRLDADSLEVHGKRIYVHNSYDRREYTYERGMVH